jgi:hypothetical protein
VSTLRARKITGAARRCPYCRGALRPEAHAPALWVIGCAKCGTPHHTGCFLEHGGCTLLGCSSQEVLWANRCGLGDLAAALDAARAAPEPTGAPRALGWGCAGFLHLIVIAAIPLFHYCVHYLAVEEPHTIFVLRHEGPGIELEVAPVTTSEIVDSGDLRDPFFEPFWPESPLSTASEPRWEKLVLTPPAPGKAYLGSSSRRGARR